ncbi:MAG TPA: LptA/OstA family protein [Methylomirabilota bacterium]|nr:LptA/OstA family protein [Methylomirabilota bacterium]
MTCFVAPPSRRRALTIAAGMAAAAVLPRPRSAVAAQGQSNDPFGSGQSNLPIEIEAEQGIEWRKNEKVYIARGNATAKRGDQTVYADTLTAHYRDKPDGGTEIWQIEADGHVRMTSPDRTATGEHAVYNLDTRVLHMTGSNLRIDTGKETLTARDGIEYQDNALIAIARGNAVVVQGTKQVTADKMTGHFERQTDGKSRLVRVEANGNVQVKTPNTFATGNEGDYDVDKDFMTLTGNVKVTNGQNQFNGEHAEVDVKSGVSRLVGGSDGTGKVKSLIMPSSSSSSPSSSTTTP